MFQFNDLTIIIPTYSNRYRFVIRTAEYWNNTGSDIIILDESMDPMPKNLQLLLPESSLYKHTPSESFYDRLKIATNLVKTPYVIICPDDNFMLHSTVHKCILKIKEQPELLACAGIYTWFTCYNGDIYSLEKISDLRLHNPLSDNISQRLIECQEVIFMYGVWRTRTLRTCVKMLPDKHSSPAVLLCTLQCGLAYMGKWGEIRELMWLRSYEKPSASKKNGTNRNIRFQTWYEEKAYQSEVQETFSKMVAVLSEETQSSQLEIDQNLKAAFKNFAELSIRQYEKEQSNNRVKKRRRIIQIIAPLSFKKAWRYYKYKNLPPGILLTSQLSWLEENNIQIDIEEVNNVKQFIKRFYA